MPTRRQTGARPEPTPSDFERACRHAELTPQPGLSAVKGEYRPGVALKSGHRHTASIDLDACFLASEPTAARWDYGIGVRGSRLLGASPVRASHGRVAGGVA